MLRWSLAALLALVPAAQINASNKADITANGTYLEARTCDVWTGACFANADFNIGGKQGLMAWRIEKGQAGDVSLDGLSVVAVVTAANTIGLEQNSPAKAVIIVDSRANAAQRDALVRFAQQQGGALVANVLKVHSQSIDIHGCPCKSDGCFEVNAGIAKLKTRCLDPIHDKICGFGNETFYPPMASNLKVAPAGVIEQAFRGDGLGATWSDADRRAAYVGTFQVR